MRRKRREISGALSGSISIWKRPRPFLLFCCSTCFAPFALPFFAASREIHIAVRAKAQRTEKRRRKEGIFISESPPLLAKLYRARSPRIPLAPSVWLRRVLNERRQRPAPERVGRVAFDLCRQRSACGSKGHLPSARRTWSPR